MRPPRRGGEQTLPQPPTPNAPRVLTMRAQTASTSARTPSLLTWLNAGRLSVGCCLNAHESRRSSVRGSMPSTWGAFRGRGKQWVGGKLLRGWPSALRTRRDPPSPNRGASQPPSHGPSRPQARRRPVRRAARQPAERARPPLLPTPKPLNPARAPAAGPASAAAPWRRPRATAAPRGLAGRGEEGRFEAAARARGLWAGAAAAKPPQPAVRV